jgi:DNA (cytosine-5)-methyltransferase 1
VNYYNEIEPFAAAWLRSLIAAGLLPDGYVDERSITHVQPSDLKGFTQVHLFAGIGGWPLALQLAGWPTDEPAWTGSCPCQPFSKAGKGGGIDDPRHLWPQFKRLIAVCKPSVVFGEQVAGRAGRTWLSGVRTDLEALGYGVGAVDIGAASLSAPHIRQRLWWVADATHHHGGSGERRTQTAIGEERVGRWGPSSGSAGSGMGDADESRPQGLTGSERAHQRIPWQTGAGVWDNAESIPCLDGKSRRVEPGVAPLVDGFSGRVGQLRAYGNAIVPQVAAQFIKAFVAR